MEMTLIAKEHVMALMILVLIMLGRVLAAFPEGIFSVRRKGLDSYDDVM